MNQESSLDKLVRLSGRHVASAAGVSKFHAPLHSLIHSGAHGNTDQTLSSFHPSDEASRRAVEDLYQKYKNSDSGVEREIAVLIEQARRKGRTDKQIQHILMHAR